MDRFPTIRGPAALAAGALVALTTSSAAPAEEVGQVGVDWTGNDIVIEAVADPKVEGVTCHIAYFERGLVDRLSQGDWFEDPSNTVVACRQTGPISVGAVSMAPGGEDVFSQQQSLAFKSLRIKRIVDEANRTLVYLVHARRPMDGSAKMSISTVPLQGAALAAR